MIVSLLTFLFLLVPGMISYAIFTWLRSENFKILECIIGSLIFSFLINLVTFGSMVLMGTGGKLTEELFIYISTTAKYGGLAALISVVLPGIVWLISHILRGKKQ